VEASIARHGLSDRILIVEDLPHEIFLGRPAASVLDRRAEIVVTLERQPAEGTQDVVVRLTTWGAHWG
jgi:hypothetical protein